MVNPLLTTQLLSSTSNYTQSPPYERSLWDNKEWRQSIDLMFKITLSISSLRIFTQLLWWDFHWHMNRNSIWESRSKVSNVLTTLSEHPHINSKHLMLSEYEIIRLIKSKSIICASLSELTMSNLVNSMTKDILDINIITHNEYFIIMITSWIPLCYVYVMNFLIYN